MTTNVYEPPKADLSTSNPAHDKYYVVATRKFYLLSILTMGIYFIYWFYLNYSRIRATTGENLWPAPRGVFGIFFAHNLCRRIDTDLRAADLSCEWNPMPTASWFVFLSLAQALASTLSNQLIGLPFTDIASVALLPLTAAVLHPAQRAINVVCGDPEGKRNQQLTVVNWIWITLGTLLWLLILFILALAIFAPELLLE